jgi:transcriptional regulator with XRE-family HTH domain
MTLQVNTLVIEALMRLRGFTRKDLARMSGVRLENLNAWLQANDGTDHYVSRMNQSKIMQALGISGEGLRRDCVHHW